MSFDLPKYTKRDYAMTLGMVFAALSVLVGLIYAINVIVNHFLPVGCAP